MAKVYSIQPRFVKGVAHAEGWAWVDYLLTTYRTTNLPAYGSWTRDVYLAEVWKTEPITAGIFNAFMERLQSRQWKVTGGKISASRAARLLHESEGGEGLSRLLGLAGGDFIFTDKGFFGEKARRRKNSTFGPVLGLQHLDSTRMVRNYDEAKGKAGWYYVPDEAKPVLVPDENLLRIIPAPSGRDRFRGLGYCAMSRLYDALEMMIGFLQYYRQKIGNLPPEIIAIFNGMAEEQVKQAYQSYLQRRVAKDSDFYPGTMTLGNDDPGNPVSVDIVSLTGLPESFNWMNFQEWWVKTVSLNVGEASGEFWLLQHAGIGQKGYEVQAQIARGRGTGSFVYQFETKINNDIMPSGVRFEFDAKDDEQDRERADILGRNMATIERMAKAGAERMEFVFTVDEIRQTAIEVGVLDPEIAGEDVPTVLGAMLKSYSQQEVVTITSNYEVIPVKPLLTGKAADRARELYELLEGWYVPNMNLAMKGGPGSGHWGHAGRPGALGGSLPGRGLGGGDGYGEGVAPATKEPDSTMQGIAHKHMNGGGSEGKDWMDATHDERATVKDENIKYLSEQAGQDYDVVNLTVGNWAESSGDSNSQAISLQQAAAEEFGLKQPSYINEKVAMLEREQGTPPHGFLPRDGERALLRATYDHTQAELRASGLQSGDKIRLYRGVKLSSTETENWNVGDTVRVTSNPLSSWSLNQGTAYGFSTWAEKGHRGIVLEMDVPASMVFSTARTGFGCLTEGEFILLGVPSEARVAQLGRAR